MGREDDVDSAHPSRPRNFPLSLLSSPLHLITHSPPTAGHRRLSPRPRPHMGDFPHSIPPTGGQQQHYHNNGGQFSPFSSFAPPAYSSPTTGVTKATTSHATSTSSPVSQSEHSPLPPPSHHIPHAVFIIVPFAVVLLILALIIFLRYRKRRQNQQSPHQPKPYSTEMTSSSNSNNTNTRAYYAPPTMDLRPPHREAPVIVAEGNNAYLTGLDSCSQHSRRSEEESAYAPARRSLDGTFAEPPPPYGVSAAEGQPPNPYSVERDISTLPRTGSVRSPFEDVQLDEEDDELYADEIPVSDGLLGSHRNPFDDPPSPVSEIGSRPMFGRRNSAVSDL